MFLSRYFLLWNENDLGRKIIETWVTRNKLASSRRLKNDERKSMGEVREKAVLPYFFAGRFSSSTPTKKI